MLLYFVPNVKDFTKTTSRDETMVIVIFIIQSIIVSAFQACLLSEGILIVSLFDKPENNHTTYPAAVTQTLQCKSGRSEGGITLNILSRS